MKENRDWKKVWAVLESDRLQYYNYKGDFQAAGTIPLKYSLNSLEILNPIPTLNSDESSEFELHTRAIESAQNYNKKDGIGSDVRCFRAKNPEAAKEWTTYLRHFFSKK